MPSSTPSKARLANVLSALAEAGIAIARVQVAADGSFSVETGTAGHDDKSLSESENVTQLQPKKWKQR